MITNFKIYTEHLTFEYHKDLNPIFWKNDKFDEGIRIKLLRIARDLYEKSNLDLEIEDIILTGSMSNYNWTDFSDLDVHIIVDMSKYDGDIEVLKEAIDGILFQWKTYHHITLRGFTIELYIQDKFEEFHGGGKYSLLNDKWIKKPSYNKPQIDEKEIEVKYHKIEHEIKELERLSNSDLTTEDYERYFEMSKNLKKQIKNMRKEGLTTKQEEFSNANILFKELRNKGLIGNLFDTINRLYDKIFIQ